MRRAFSKEIKEVQVKKWDYIFAALGKKTNSKVHKHSNKFINYSGTFSFIQ